MLQRSLCSDSPLLGELGDGGELGSGVASEEEDGEEAALLLPPPLR